MIKGKIRIPVILDTDIGDDIDDTWAISMMVNSPELDVKLILAEFGDTETRTKIIAKMLENIGRTDIPVGIGLKLSEKDMYQGVWVADYSLEQYSGIVYQDGIRAMIDIIMNSQETITLISIGPVSNIAVALEREPQIAYKAKFVGMQGSIRKGYDGGGKISAEYNVKADAIACQKVFTTPWDITITPVDTCGLVRLTGEQYKKVHSCNTPVARVLMENYKVWDKTCTRYGQGSTILFDTVAIYLAFCEDLLNIEELGVRVTEDGYTIIDDSAKKVRCATSWKDLNAFENLLVERLIRGENK